jgi:hypothetical protein
MVSLQDMQLQGQTDFHPKKKIAQKTDLHSCAEPPLDQAVPQMLKL